MSCQGGGHPQEGRPERVQAGAEQAQASSPLPNMRVSQAALPPRGDERAGPGSPLRPLRGPRGSAQGPSLVLQLPGPAPLPGSSRASAPRVSSDLFIQVGTRTPWPETIIQPPAPRITEQQSRVDGQLGKTVGPAHRARSGHCTTQPDILLQASEGHTGKAQSTAPSGSLPRRVEVALNPQE